MRKRRCIIPTTGWYEWQKIGAKTKKPFHFKPEARPFAFMYRRVPLPRHRPEMAEGP
jgi:putative SOS response-associated peptidase YedK